VIARETFRDVFDEAVPLLVKHWREIASFQDIPLDVDVPRYLAIEDAGNLRVFTVRVDGRLVGYACFIVAPNAHYKGSLQAVQDVLYVERTARGAMHGLRLVRHCDEALAAEGVQVVTQHVKLAHPTLGVIAQRCGYEPVETIYAKRLDRMER
jgi:L-amino acid N-acyltransferase YncA